MRITAVDGSFPCRIADYLYEKLPARHLGGDESRNTGTNRVEGIDRIGFPRQTDGLKKVVPNPDKLQGLAPNSHDLEIFFFIFGKAPNRGIGQDGNLKVRR